MNRRFRFLCLIIAFVITTTVLFPAGGVSAAKSDFTSLDVNDGYTECLQKDGITFFLNTKKGNFCIYDSKTNLTFYSNPKDVLENPNLKGAPRTLAQSQIALVLLDIQGNELVINSTVESVNRNGFKAYKNSDSVKCVYKFPNYEIEIPVIYSITDGRLVVKIPSDQIKSADKDMYLSEIRVLPYFGAADVSDEGMFIVPDGCGSVVRFHSRKTPIYEQALYGKDRGKNVTQLVAETQAALLPMIAASYTNYQGSGAGLVAYVEEGQSLGIAYADAESSDKCYNTAYFGFIYRNNDLVTLMDNTSKASGVVMSEKNHVSDCDFTVSYTILPSSSYTELASAVRDRVFGGKTPEKLSDSDLPVYIQAYMSVRKTKYFLGIPYNGIVKLTDADDITGMIDDFDLPVVLTLRGLDSDGSVGGKIDSKFKTKRSVISRGELSDITEKTEKSGGKVYPVAEFTEYTKGNRAGRVLSVANLAVKHPYFNYGTKTVREEYTPYYILKSDSILKNVSSWIGSAKKRGLSACAPLSISNSPYRSGSGKGEDRNSTQKIFEKTIKSFEKNKFDLLFEEAAAYVIPYASHIRSVPVSSSGFSACDTEIPFIQMVLHGVKSYSMPSVNFSGNANVMLLKAIETGSAYDYTFIGTDYSALKETPLDSLNGSDYSLWKDVAPEMTKNLVEVMKGTNNAYIIDYRIITDDVRAVCYENGSCFVVNYGETDYTVNGVTVKAQGFEKIEREVLG